MWFRFPHRTRHYCGRLTILSAVAVDGQFPLLSSTNERTNDQAFHVVPPCLRATSSLSSKPFLPAHNTHRQKLGHERRAKTCVRVHAVQADERGRQRHGQLDGLFTLQCVLVLQVREVRKTFASISLRQTFCPVGPALASTCLSHVLAS